MSNQKPTTTSTKPIICLMGPTASGKSQLAETLAQGFPCEIVNVDSALIYRGMDIGTAKPSAEILASIPHHLINICDPSEAYSVANFIRDATAVIHNIVQRQAIPLLVGGTMMYFKALLQGLSDLPSSDPEIRGQIEQRAQQEGLGALHEELQRIDPVAAKRIHPNDPQRLQRALEVYYLTGKTLTELQGQRQPALKGFKVLSIAIAPATREGLHQRIEQRLQQMLAAGFVEEVRGLYERGDLQPNLPALRAVGYRQAWQYLAGDMDYETMVNKILFATRQLAKRQMTWLRAWDGLHWFDSEQETLVEEVRRLLRGALDQSVYKL